MKIGDIVSFKEPQLAQAAQWCCDNMLHGKIVVIKSDVAELDVGLYYKIYVKLDQLDLVAEIGEISEVSKELADTAPISDEGC